MPRVGAARLRFAKICRWFWRHRDDFEIAGRLIVACAPVAIVLAAIALLNASGQMQDLIASIAGDPKIRADFERSYAVCMTMALFIAIWRANQIENPYLDRGERPLFFFGAKALIYVVFAILLIFLQPNGVEFQDETPMFLLALLMGVIIGLSHAARREGARTPRQLMASIGGKGPAGRLIAFVGAFYILYWLLVATAGFGFVFLTDWMTDRFGAPVAIMLFVWSGFVVAFWFFDRGSWVLIAGMFLLYVGVYSDQFGLRPVRTLPIDAGAGTPAEKAVLPDDGPIFLVASDGGGIRAAYWSARVLGAIARERPDFPGHVFALSGASGGAVGLGVFAALIHDKREPRSMAAEASVIFSKDYISPAVSHLLWRDTVVSALRLCSEEDRAQGLLCGQDRITAMETRLERAYAEMTGADTLAGSIPLQPLVFFNSSEVATGKTHVLTRFDPGLADASADLGASPVTLIADGAPFSTAMFMSARFPVISPDAAVNPADGAFRRTDGVQVETATLVDGGYADNVGATALIGLLRGVLAERDDVYVISIVNDPTRPEEGAAPCAGAGASKGSSALRRLLTTPLTTLDGVRARASEALRDRLRAVVTETQGNGRFHLVALGCSGEVNVPLGWTLSPAARSYLDGRADALMVGGGPLDAFVRAALEARQCGAASGWRVRKASSQRVATIETLAPAVGLGNLSPHPDAHPGTRR